MKIKHVVLTKSYTGFYFDDQLAIKKDAEHDGFLYIGEPLTPGFKQVRVPGEAISIQLILENGMVAVGDCASVQYSGAGGRDPLFLAHIYMPFMEKHLIPRLIGEDVSTFKELAEKYDQMHIDSKPLHTAIRYGLTQALLHATALSHHITMAEVIRNEYNKEHRAFQPIPIFGQSGDDRYNNVDKMILKSLDSMPHALINNVKEKLGYQGEILLDYIIWMRNRILKYRLTENYHPVLHVDLYGTMGIAFHNDIARIVDYIITLEHAAKPFKLRVESPIDGGNREDTMIALKTIRMRLEEQNSEVEIVADEWCNTLEDIKYFADHKAGHILQIKTPDLGGVNNIAEAILYCKSKNIGAYCGGTCNETNISAQVTTHIALACQADVVIAKPGMDVDGGFMIVKNEMERTLGLIKQRK
ncbi:MAG: methylaspartate ammonia-lyase [Acholeplasmataceae bacterium]